MNRKLKRKILSIGFLFLALFPQGNCRTLHVQDDNKLSYRVGQQVERLKRAVKSNDIEEIREEASSAQTLIQDLNEKKNLILEAQAVCKDDLIQCVANLKTIEAEKLMWQIAFWSIFAIGGILTIVVAKLKWF